MSNSHLIISGSVRNEGKCHALACELQSCFEKQAKSKNENAPYCFSFANNIDIDPCLACDCCKFKDGCIIEDDMQGLYSKIENSTSLSLISPVYFAGPSAQLKALLDRLQPYFWQEVRFQQKRPAELFVVGDGGDPHGFEPLVGIVKSALSVAGFELLSVHPLIGINSNWIKEYARESLFLDRVAT